MILLLGMVFFAACSDDNSKEVDWRSPIKIVNSDILFEGGKATGGLRVAAPVAITAQISASWCHIAVVNGDSITVSVDENKEIAGRSAAIRISCGDQSLDAVVQQKGLSFLPHLVSTLSLESDHSVMKFYVKHTSDAKAWSDVAWLKASVDGDSLVVETSENAGTAGRPGKVYVQSGPYTDSMEVYQAYSFDKAYLRTYNLMYHVKSAWKSVPVELAKAEDGSYLLRFADKNNAHLVDLAFPVEVDKTKMTFSIANLSLLGSKDYKGKTYRIMTLIMGLKKGTTSVYRYKDASIKVVASPKVVDGKVNWNFTPNESFDSSVYEFAQIRLALSKDGTYSGYTTPAWLDLPSLYLVQAD